MEIRTLRAAGARRAVAIANRHPRLRLDRRALARAVHVLDAHFQVRPGERRFLTRPPAAVPPALGPGELSLVFLTDPALAQLHADFLDDPTPTDVITFEGDAAHGTAGEICVSVDTAAAYARRHGRDFGGELLLYVVHGWLHLAGYDDLRPERKRVMRRAEARARKLLAAAGLPAPFAWRR